MLIFSLNEYNNKTCTIKVQIWESHGEEFTFYKQVKNKGCFVQKPIELFSIKYIKIKRERQRERDRERDGN